jgi:hypothetical protein
MPDPIDLCPSLPPESGVAHPVGLPKGEGAVRIHREPLHERRSTGLPFGAVGDRVGTVGRDEARARRPLREPEESERRQGAYDFERPLRPRRGLPLVPAPGRGPPQGTGPLGGHPKADVVHPAGGLR